MTGVAVTVVKRMETNGHYRELVQKGLGPKYVFNRSKFAN